MTGYERMKAKRRAESLRQGIKSSILRFALPNNSAKVKFTLNGKEVHFTCMRTREEPDEIEIYLTEEI